MANRDTLGFRPYGAENNTTYIRFPVTTSNGTNLFVGDAVRPESNGGITPLDAGATVSDVALGVIVALYDSNKIPVGSPNSTSSTKYLAASTAGYALVAIAKSGARFIGQSQTGTSYAATDVMAAVNVVAGSGNTTTGVSGYELGATGGTDCIILGLYDEPGNAWGSENVNVIFSFMTSYLGQVNPTGGV